MAGELIKTKSSNSKMNQGGGYVKRIIPFLTLLLLTAILTGCSSEPSFELIDSSVTITNNRDIAGAVGITEGEKKGQELVPTVLCYKFTLKNYGLTAVGVDKIEYPNKKGLEVKIEPNEKLMLVLQETVGINVFKPDSYKGTGLGYGDTLSLILKPGEQAESFLTFDLGVSEKSPNATLIVPSAEKLEKLLKYATDADLVILDKGVEIERFDLSKSKIGEILEEKTTDILPSINDWNKEIVSDKPGETHIRYYVLKEDGNEETVLDVYAMTEEHDLDDDGLNEIVVYLPGEKKNIGIYDLTSGVLNYIDVSSELDATWSEYMGNMGNLQRKYLNYIEVGFEKGDVKRYEIYQYKNNTLIYLCPFDDTLLMQ